MRWFNLGMSALLAVPLATGCVSMGTNYDPAAVAQLTQGMAQADVIARLGKPNTRVTLADGSQQLGWIHSRGTLGGGKARALTLVFDSAGRYQKKLSEAETDLRFH